MSQQLKTHGRKIGFASTLIGFSGFYLANLVRVNCETGQHVDNDVTQIIEYKIEPETSQEREHFRWSRIWPFIANDYILLIVSIAVS